MVIARKWLAANGYADVVQKIDTVTKRIAARGSKERRNWWDVLAGAKTGSPSVWKALSFQC